MTIPRTKANLISKRILLLFLISNSTSLANRIFKQQENDFICLNGKNPQNLTPQEILIQFAKGPCSPAIIVPGSLSTKLVVEIINALFCTIFLNGEVGFLETVDEPAITIGDDDRNRHLPSFYLQDFRVLLWFRRLRRFWFLRVLFGWRLCLGGRSDGVLREDGQRYHAQEKDCDDKWCWVLHRHQNSGAGILPYFLLSFHHPQNISAQNHFKFAIGEAAPREFCCQPGQLRACF